MYNHISMNMKDKIKKENLLDIFPLTQTQQAMMYNYLYSPDSLLYYEQINVYLHGHIKRDIMEQAIQYVIEENELLNSIFRWKGLESPVQIVLKKQVPPVFWTAINENNLQEYFEVIYREKINIEKHPIKFYFLDIGDDRVVLVIKHHHILLDGWSNAIVIEKILKYYDVLISGKTILKSKNGSYKEYLKAYTLSIKNKSESIRYWYDLLKTYPFSDVSKYITANEAVEKLPETCKLQLEEKIYQNIQDFTKKQGLTLAGFFFLVWGLWLQKQYVMNDVIFGTVISGRNIDVDYIEKMVGMFATTIPFRFCLDSIDIEQIIKNVKMQMHEREMYLNATLTDIANSLNKKKIFDTLVVIENYPIYDKVLEGQLKLVDIDVIENTNFDLTFCVDIGKKLSFRLIRKPESIIEYELDEILQQLNIIIGDLLKGKVNMQQEVNNKISISQLDNHVYNEKSSKDNEVIVQNDSHVDIDAILINIIKKVSGPIKINKEVGLFENGIDSLKAMFILFNICKEFNIDMQLKELLEVKNIKELTILIRRMISKREKEQIKIPLKEDKNDIPASMQQRRIYFAHQTNPNSIIYHIPIVLEFKGNVVKEHMENSIQKLIDRHSILRTKFEIKDNDVFQIVENNLKFQMNEITIEEFTDNTDFLHAYIYPFHLENPPLIRGYFISALNNTKIHWLLLDIHHSLVDGTSLNLLVSELMLLYNGKDLPEIKHEYKDYAIQQYNSLTTDVWKEQEKYWLSSLEGQYERLILPIDEMEQFNEEFIGKHVGFEISSEEVLALKKLAVDESITQQVIFLSAVNLLFYRYSGQKHIIVGLPVVNRTKQTYDTIGIFVNLLIIKNVINPIDSLHLLLHQVQDNMINALNNQEYPYELLLEKLNVINDGKQNPLVNVLFLYQNIMFQKLQFDGLETRQVDFVADTNNFDLTIELVEANDKIKIRFKYNSNKFQEQTIRRMLADYIKIVHFILEDSTQKINSIMEMFVQDSQTRSIDLKRNEKKCSILTTSFYLHDQVRLISTLVPEKKAFTWEENDYSYFWIEEMSNKASNFCREIGCRKNDIIAIFADRSIDMVVLVLGIIKLGGICLPIDTQNTANRVIEILRISSAKMVLTCSSEYTVECDILQYSAPIKAYENYSSELPHMEYCSNAYCIFTSGSTGKPKGVILKHSGIYNHIMTKIVEGDFTENDVFSMNLNVGFVASIWLIFVNFYLGARTVIFSKTDVENLHHFFNKLIKCNVTILEIIPSLLDEFIKINGREWGIKSLKTIFLTGEKVIPAQIRNIYGALPFVSLINAYGQSECSDDTLHYHIQQEDAERKTIPVGRTALNTSVYIMDEQGNVMPNGAYGEICISGPGVVDGYLEEPAETKAHFGINPFNEETKLFRTGDFGRVNEEGMIEYVGRRDEQIKINGIRVEMAEIETKIETVQGVNRCCVLYKNKSEVPYIVAFYTGNIDSEQLRQKIREVLPGYMIPASLYPIPEMPLTVNGKIDKKRLDSISEEIQMVDQKIEVFSSTEQTIKNMWSELLQKKVICKYDNFFQLGGNSIKVMALVGRIRKEFSVTIDFKTIVDNPTIELQAKWIEQADYQKVMIIQTAPKQIFYTLSSQQERIFWACEKDKNSTAYNNTLAFHVYGNLDKDSLKKSLYKLIRRHDILRSTFHIFDDQIVMRVHSEITVDFLYENAKVNILENLANYITPFNLQNGPLFRFICFRVNKSHHICLLDIHHLISDGTSLQIIIRDLLRFYRSDMDVFDENSIQYVDYLYWLTQFKLSEQYKKEEEYWINKYKSGIPQFNLPYDYEWSISNKGAGNTVFLLIPRNKVDEIFAYTKSNNIMLFDFFYAAFQMLLFRYSGEEKHFVYTTISGRTRPEFEQVVGLFVNNLLICLSLQGEKSLRELIIEIKDITSEAFSNSDYDYENIIKNTTQMSQQDTSTQIMFVFQNYDNSEINFQNLSIETISIQKPIAKMDITVEIYEVSEGINIKLEYADNKFSEESMNYFLQYYKNLLDQILKYDQMTLEDVDLLPENKPGDTVQSIHSDPTTWLTIPEIYRKNAELIPAKIAVSDQNRILNYREVEDRSNQLARKLKEKGVKENSIVALRLGLNSNLLIASLAVLKLSAICLPIDLQIPGYRVEQIMNDCNAYMLLENEMVDSIYNEKNNNLYDYERGADHIDKNAYLIYTSGSTGTPKGVLLQQRGILNHIMTKMDTIGLTAEDVLCLSLKSGFVATIWQLYTPAYLGTKLIIYPENYISDINKLLNVADYDGVTIIETVPSILQSYLEILKNGSNVCHVNNIKKLILTGERVSTTLVNYFYFVHPEIQLYNAYGQSECSDDTMHYKIETREWNSSIPIGRPSYNTTVYILDSRMRPLPYGIYGDIYIDSIGLSSGYINNPDETNKVFLEHPFVPGKRIYKTGDIGRWKPDGTVEYVGRKDRQVKIRGNRIELDEIEEEIKRIDGVQHVAVIYQEKESLLAAFIVGQISSINIRDILARRVPLYMIPTLIYPVNEIVLNVNGKIDYTRLHELVCQVDILENSKENMHIYSDIEEKLLLIWEKVFNKKSITVRDDFFDLGGDSLKAIQIVHLIRQKFDVELTYEDIINYTTIKSIEKKIQQKLNLFIDKETKKNSRQLKLEYPVTPVQQDMFVQQQLQPGSIAYNMTVAVKVQSKKGRIDK